MTLKQGFNLNQILSLAALAAIVVAILFGLAWCGQIKETDKAVAAKQQADARTLSAGDAGLIRDKADERIAEINATANEAINEVRSETDPAARNRAARVGVCRINSDASPDCGMLLASSD